MIRRRLAPLFLLALDFACLVVAFHAISWLRGSPGIGAFDNPELLPPFAVLVLAVYLIDGYSTRTDMLSLAYTSQHAIALLASMLVMLLVTYVFIREQYSLQSSRAVIALSFVALIPLTLVYRRWLALRVAAVRKKQPIIFVGSEASCMMFKESCANNHLEQQVLYVATDAAADESVSPWVGLEMYSISQLVALVDRLGNQVEAVVLHDTSRDLPFAVAERLMELHFSGVHTYTLELFH